MPIFEYTCQSCGHHFDHLTRVAQDAACPACDSTILEKHLSTFAVRANGGSSRSDVEALAPCGSCGDPRGPGACSMN
jgi:putative FmdB family regulatory protein